MDPGGGNHDLPVVGVELALVVSIDRRLLTDLAELLRILFLNLAPPAPPFLPLVLREVLRVHAFAPSPWDPSDAAGDGAPVWMRGTK